MAITQQELGRRIKAAREANRLTQEEVSRYLAIARPAVAQIEAGHRAVSSLELDKLSILFGRDIREFVAESFSEDDTLAALFRAQPEVTKQPEVLDKLRECMVLGRELTNLEHLVGIDRDVAAVASYVFPAPRSPWEALQQGQRLADEERRRLGLGVGPAPDIAELLETQGVRTGLVALPEDVSGITLSDRKVGLFVVANKQQHLLRRRFSYTHEYAHIVVDRDRSGLISKTSERDNLIEVRANAFASCFLMPEEGVLQFVACLGKGKPSRFYGEVFDGDSATKVEGRTEPQSQDIQLYDIVQMAHHFGVSRSAAIYRLRRLRLITDQERESLQALDDAGKGRHIAQLFGLSEPNHEEARNEFKHRFLGLALEAYRRDEISMGKLKELSAMVELSSGDLEQLLDEAGLDA